MSMDLTGAPLFTDHAPGPEDGEARWLITSDKLRIRVAAWGREAARGTVLLFPGRTEYIEKYAPAAADLAQRGYATLAVDWRGQGLADRLTEDARIGHVGRFTDYQRDVGAMLRAARAMNMPRPWVLLAHSMGGCIGLRAAMEGLPVQAVCFTGPMWGIAIAPHMRLPAMIMTRLMPALGRGTALPPGTKIDPYVLTDPFEDNMLTRDREMHDMMRIHLEQHPELSLGGPGFHWLREALAETKTLAQRPSPNLPCLTWLGSHERIVHVPRIHQRMEQWPGGRLEMVEDAEHEVIMEIPATRACVFDETVAFFDKSIG